MSHELGEVVTIAELARRVGWSVSRMRRHLVALNESNDGALLTDISRGTERPRWVVSVAKLRELAPAWFGRAEPEDLEHQVEWLAHEVTELRGLIKHAHRRIDQQTARILALVKETKRA